MDPIRWTSLGLALLLAACGGSSGPGGYGGSGGTSPAAAVGHISYTLNGKVYLIEARENAAPLDIGAALEPTAPGSDAALNISPDGSWLALATTRFDPVECTNPCLAVAPVAYLSQAALVRAGGNAIHPELFAIASGGARIVYSAGGGTHSRDLWVLNPSGATWSTPAELTTTLDPAKYAWLDHPAISSDGLKVLFDCGLQPFAATGTAICEIGTDGTGFREVVNPADAPPTITSVVAVRSADYAPDGSIVFEAEWDGERAWRRAAGGGLLQIGDFPNDNSPCVLPDGRIASLWLNRSGNLNSYHELKVMSADGSTSVMALTGADVADIGLGCGQ